MITYSSTTLTNVSDGASNLSPFFSHKLTDIYNAENNPNGYWMDNGTSYGWTKNSKFTFTQLEDGWLHVHVDNSSGTATIRNDCCVPKYNPSIKRATKYTFLAEFRNNQSTGAASGSDFYLVQQSGSVQFWGQNVSTTPLIHLEGIGSVTVPISEIPSDGSYAFSRFTKYSEPGGESSHWTTNEKMVTFTFRANAGAVLDYDVRLSVYEGEYWGNYVPYVISDVTDIRNSAEDANYKIDNLEIGGRNLLLKSDREVSNANYNIIIYNLSDKGQELQEGDIITFSMKARILPERQRWAIYNSGSSLNISSWQAITPDGNSDIIYTWTGEWKVNYNGSPVANTKLYVYLGTGSGTENNTIYWAKLEKGHKMTDWTLAPEDIQASIQEYAQSIQSQVDGMAEIHYGTVAPTLSNAPASAWTDTKTKDMHVDDLYYNTSTGYCYRFTKSGSTYSWTRIKDSDITAAATAASNANTAAGNAQTTANNANTLAGQKRRIFVSQPTPPYEVGDLWVEGSNGDIKKCKTARATGSYTASDWELASKYTDDTLASEANDKIDNLEIGGRNLLSDTTGERYSSGSANDSAYITPTYSYTDFGQTLLNNTEDTFTYSFNYEVTGNNSNTGYIYTQMKGSQIAGGTSTGRDLYVLNQPTGKYCCVFKLNATQASSTSVYAGIRLRSATDGAVLKVWNVKLEKGNKPTTWTPAPEDTQADIDTALAQSIWYATCADAGATKSAVITPTTTNFVLNVGTTVNVKFNNTNTGAVESLTLNINNTGAKNIKYIYNGSISNIPGAGYLKGNQTYQFYYDGTYWIVQMMYNSNNVDRTQYGIALAASEAISSVRIAVLGTNKKLHLLNTTAFDITCPPLYVGTAYSTDNVTAGTTRTSNYRYWGTAFNYTDTHSIAGAVAGKPVYIVGTLNGNVFTPNSTVLTCTEPTTEDGLYYMRLGTMSTTTNGVLEMDHPIYVFYNGSFITIEEAEAEKAQNLATAVYGTCSTGATTVDKVITCPNFTLFEGARIQITFTNANTAIASETTTASPTLNVNGTGAKPIKIGIETANATNPLYWAAGATIEFVYDGSAWVLQNAPYTLYGSCNTEENVREKQVACDGAVICKGTTIYVGMFYSNAADSNSENGNVTLNVANTIAKTIYANNSTLTIRSRYNWNAGENPSFTFDGQYWQMNKDTVPAYITDNDDEGIFVHPVDDTTSGWSIGKVFELLNNGYSYIKMWLEDVTDNLSAKIRIGREDQHHILLDKEIIQFKKGDTSEELASFSSSGISFDDGVPFKIGNDSTYVQFVDNNSDGVADALEIVADKISFKNGGNNTVQDIQERFNDLQTNISNITNNIEINPTADTPYVAITTQKNEYNAGLKLEPTQLSFQLNGQTTATIANDEMNIPTASVTNLFMQSANQSYEKIWVMRSNGHLSLKVGKQN